MDIIEMRKRLGTWTRADSFLCNKDNEWEWDHTGRPKWMIQQLKVRRWKERFRGARGLTSDEKWRRKRVVTVMNWIEWRARRKSREALPRWFTKDAVWQEWKRDAIVEQGISREERELRKFLLHYYNKLEDKIHSSISSAKY